MLHIPKVDDYLKILTDDEVKDFVAINFSEYFKSTREKLNSIVFNKFKKPDNFRQNCRVFFNLSVKYNS